ncbi:hypothetical protein I4F81_003208 [Pyropia yezoensis]|uniref:Uncharacterized protein n=1 Tax=Pyropia yezoensis TaxID=2788 RepID=A0ACC3BRR1_PYRYE|nr:hypothetical protein I4F81_003208 [Neopyropia yezoensis]
MAARPALRRGRVVDGKTVFIFVTPKPAPVRTPAATPKPKVVFVFPGIDFGKLFPGLATQAQASVEAARAAQVDADAAVVTVTQALADAQAEIAAVDPALVTAEVTAQLAELQRIVDDATANAATAAAEVVNAETALAQVQAAVDEAAALIVSLGGTVPTARMLQLSGRLRLSNLLAAASPAARFFF